MQALLGLLLISAILGSPLWISLLVLAVPRRLVILDILLCALQAVIVYVLWWFFWGGGIGGELRLSAGWKVLGLVGLAPLLVAFLKHTE
jgi:hypothetical protein